MADDTDPAKLARDARPAPGWYWVRSGVNAGPWEVAQLGEPSGLLRYERPRDLFWYVVGCEGPLAKPPGTIGPRLAEPPNG